MFPHRLFPALGAIALSMLLCSAEARTDAAPPSTAPVVVDEGYLAPSLPVEDAMEFHEPKAMPAIVDPLSDAEYQKRVAALHLAAPMTAAAAREHPVLVVVAAGVEHAGVADRAGVKAGDILAAMEGETLLYTWQVWDAEEDNAETLFAVSTAGQAPRSVKLDGGQFDLTPETRWNAAVAWERMSNRDPRYDAFIRVAAAAYLNDPTLAWSALARAQKAGWDGSDGGYVPPTIAALTAFADRRFDDALSFGAFARNGMPHAEGVFFLNRMLTSAMASCKLPYCLELFKSPLLEHKRKSDPERQAAMQEAIAGWKKSSSRAAHANPLSEIGGYDFRDVTAMAAPLVNDPKDLASKWVADRLRERRKFSVDVVASHCIFGSIGPGGRNIDGTVEFSFKAYENQVTPMGHTFTIGLAAARRPGDPPGPATRYLARINLFHNGMVTVSRYTPTDYTFWQPPTTGHHHARVVVIGQRCEIILDGRRVLYCTLAEDEKDRELGLIVSMIGVKSVVHQCTLKIADAKPEKPQ